MNSKKNRRAIRRTVHIKASSSKKKISIIGQTPPQAVDEGRNPKHQKYYLTHIAIDKYSG
jgi:hypothetical protein